MSDLQHGSREITRQTFLEDTIFHEYLLILYPKCDNNSCAKMPSYPFDLYHLPLTFHDTRRETIAWLGLRNNEICYCIVNEIKRLNKEGRENLEDFRESKATHNAVYVAKWNLLNIIEVSRLETFP